MKKTVLLPLLFASSVVLADSQSLTLDGSYNRIVTFGAEQTQNFYVPTMAQKTGGQAGNIETMTSFVHIEKEDITIISFVGPSVNIGKNHLQPIVTVLITTGDGKSAPVPAKGQCTRKGKYDSGNPVEITCAAVTEYGQFSTEFITNGEKPTISTSIN